MSETSAGLLEKQREIAEALLNIGGVGFKPDAPVTFKSGIQSPVYCDNRRFPFWPAEWRKVIAGFGELIVGRGIAAEVIAGVEAAGIPHSAALGRPSIFVRKEAKSHGTKKRVEGGDVTGRRVVLIEDMISTGMSSMAAIRALREEGAIVTDCMAIIRYNFPEATELFAAEGVTLHTTTNFEAVLEAALGRCVIDATGAVLVQDWLREPWGWAKRHGFEVAS
jgi:orotate phosphoribosyltransferase